MFVLRNSKESSAEKQSWGVKYEVMQGFLPHDEIFGFDSECAEEPLERVLCKE